MPTNLILETRMPGETRGMLSGLGPIVPLSWLSRQAAHTESALGSHFGEGPPGWALL